MKQQTLCLLLISINFLASGMTPDEEQKVKEEFLNQISSANMQKAKKCWNDLPSERSNSPGFQRVTVLKTIAENKNKRDLIPIILGTAKKNNILLKRLPPVDMAQIALSDKEVFITLMSYYKTEESTDIETYANNLVESFDKNFKREQIPNRIEPRRYIHSLISNINKPPSPEMKKCQEAATKIVQTASEVWQQDSREIVRRASDEWKKAQAESKPATPN